jgi:hypothetical protein
MRRMGKTRPAVLLHMQRKVSVKGFARRVEKKRTGGHESQSRRVPG